ncbi:MAG: 2-phosphosulfolactate phosphatase [Elusimicrobiota bacterium]|jgi:phosphosulfolactate phosphohydrolase-like enzyme|nr:2-phosphosulfolactate phosphatase [Elusimicrobiota bacterium]
MRTILTAKTKKDCIKWTKTAIVIDVLRSSSTVCALLQAGKKDIRLYADKKEAAAYKKINAAAEFFSELDFEEKFDKYDNSPSLAIKSSHLKPALIITTAGTPAVMALKKADKIFMGGFCNFSALIKYLKLNECENILFVPSSLFGFDEHTEDAICARECIAALSRADNASRAIENFKKTKRFADFLKGCPLTAKEDARLALTLNSIPQIPLIKIYDSFALINKYQ